MPDDYYVSQYSGEEIDALLGGAGAGTVRYDAAQTLTDAQKTQARANIAAAPDGFGLGKRNVTLTASDDLDNVMGNGWYYWGSSTPANAPALINANSSSDYCAMFMISGSQIVASFIDRNNMAMRSKNMYGWTPWEYINPPLKLGVEYRTTERFLGKPVYVKAINFGSLPNATSKTVEWGSDNVQPIRYSGRTETAGRYAFPYAHYIQCAVSGNTIVVYTTVDYSAYTASFTVYYTKYTD